MKIVFLDAKTIGDDIDLSGFDSLGEVTKYNFTTPEEAPERVKDADVLEKRCRLFHRNSYSAYICHAFLSA